MLCHNRAIISVVKGPPWCPCFATLAGPTIVHSVMQPWHIAFQQRLKKEEKKQENTTKDEENSPEVMKPATYMKMKMIQQVPWSILSKEERRSG